MKAPEHALDELAWRGLVAHTTDDEALRAHLASGPVSAYCGFDPTAPSLHMGNLLQLLTLRRLQSHGHKPIGIVGGATGMIGDPKQAGERKLNSLDTVSTWSSALRGQVERFWDFDGPSAATVVNNYDWTRDLSAIDFLRDVGKHFPVNRMLDREAVRARLDSGISYTEFSYVLLQSLDYLELHRRYGCSLQTGGSDQWGNITAGVELIRRVEGAKVHALATPLVTRSDGTKFGKTESGTIWLDAGLTSPYAFYQFWINTDDADVGRMLRYFTFRTPEAILELEQEVVSRPGGRAAQRTLADDVTRLVHGEAAARQVVAASEALFGGGDLESLEAATLDAALSEAPHTDIAAGAGLPNVVELLVQSGLAPSKGAARRTVLDGGAYLNNQRVNDPESVPTQEDLLHGRWLVLRRGKRTIAALDVQRG